VESEGAVVLICDPQENPTTIDPINKIVKTILEIVLEM
jgi:hypothetical protein